MCVCVCELSLSLCVCVFVSRVSANLCLCAFVSLRLGVSVSLCLFFSLSLCFSACMRVAVRRWLVEDSSGSFKFADSCDARVGSMHPRGLTRAEWCEDPGGYRLDLLTSCARFGGSEEGVLEFGPRAKIGDADPGHAFP